MYNWAFSASQRNQHQQISSFSYVNIDNRPFLATALVNRNTTLIPYMSGLLSRDPSNQFYPSRHYLTHDALKTLICAFVLSPIDYCNSLLAGCPKNLICNLQKVKNNAARLISRSARSDHTYLRSFVLYTGFLSNPTFSTNFFFLP